MEIKWYYAVEEVVHKENLFHRGESVIHFLKDDENTAKKRLEELSAHYPDKTFVITRRPAFV